MSNYAEEREENIARNKRMLEELDLVKLKPRAEPKEPRRKKTAPANGRNNKRKTTHSEATDEDDAQAEKQPRKKTARVDPDVSAGPGEGRRRSSRIASQPGEVALQVDQRRGTPLPISVKAIVPSASGGAKRRHDPKRYGPIPGIEVGSWWASREECSNDAIHAEALLQAQTAHTPSPYLEVTTTIVDEGYAFTIHWCRDLRGTKAAPKNVGLLSTVILCENADHVQLRTAEQSFDQSFENNHNKALKRSAETGKPIRVIRGFKLRSKYGPSEGYRYDGLYVVKKCWQEKGLNKGGFLVCKYAFVRLPNQPDIFVKGGNEEEPESSADEGDSDADGVTD
ncbi:PUA-like domain-containing protein [Melanogaster broomeanus]|nr:PUA-like domain-containing protein [Melanogaster broomeanus]